MERSRARVFIVDESWERGYGHFSDEYGERLRMLLQLQQVRGHAAGEIAAVYMLEAVEDFLCESRFAGDEGGIVGVGEGLDRWEYIS
jgi:hypothetical protein